MGRQQGQESIPKGKVRSGAPRGLRELRVVRIRDKIHEMLKLLYLTQSGPLQTGTNTEIYTFSLTPVPCPLTHRYYSKGPWASSRCHTDLTSWKWNKIMSIFVLFITVTLCTPCLVITLLLVAYFKDGIVITLFNL